MKSNKKFYAIMLPLILAVIILLYVVNAAIFVRYKPDGHRFPEPKDNAHVETVLDSDFCRSVNAL